MSSTSPPSPSPTVLRLAAPLVVSFVMRAAFTLVDTVYAATLGDAAVAGIGLAVPFEFAMIAVWVGLSTGLTSCLSRAIGAGEGRKIEQYLKTAWIMVWTVAPIFLLIGAGIWFAFPRGHLTESVYDAFRVYGAVLIGGSAFTAFWSVIPDSLVKAHHDTRSTMWAGIISNLINVTLNTFFVFALHWGMFGIAFSTVLGRIGGLVYALKKAAGHERRRKAAGADRVAELEPRPYAAILALAIPSSIVFVLMATETAVINLLLSFFDHNTEALAAYSIYYRVVMFAINPVIAASVALLPYTARRFGERDLPGVRLGLRQTLSASAVYTLGILAPVMLLTSRWIAAGLGESALTIRFATFGLRLVPVACLATVPFLLCRPVFEGMQRGRPGLAIAALRYGVLTAPLAWLGLLAAQRIGVPPFYGLIVGLILASALSSGVFYVWLARVLQAMKRKGVLQPAFEGE